MGFRDLVTQSLNDGGILGILGILVVWYEIKTRNLQCAELPFPDAEGRDSCRGGNIDSLLWAHLTSLLLPSSELREKSGKVRSEFLNPGGGFGIFAGGGGLELREKMIGVPTSSTMSIREIGGWGKMQYLGCKSHEGRDDRVFR